MKTATLNLRHFTYVFRKNGNEIVQYLAAFCATINIITSGMGYGWPSPSLPQLQNFNNTNVNLHVTSSEGSWLAIMPLLGAVIGSPLAGSTVDFVGRKRMILLSFFPYLFSFLGVAFATNIYTLYIARFLCGFSDGAIFTSAPMYIGEIANPKVRGLLGSWVAVCLTTGVLIINIIGDMFTITGAALISIIFPLTCFITMLPMPESPYMLLMDNKPEQARRSLVIFRGSDNVDEELERMANAVKTAKEESKGKFKDLLTVPSNRKALFIMMLLRAAQQLSGITALTFYLNTIFYESGAVYSPTTATIIFFSVQLIMAVVGSAIVDMTGRRFLLIVSGVGSVISLFIEAFYFYFEQKGADISSFTYVPLMGLITYIIFYGVGLQNIPILMLGELFPTNIKGFSLCFADLYFALLASAVSKLFQIMNDSYGMASCFFFFAISCGISLIFIILYVPETKGITLEEIQGLLKNGKPRNKKAETVSENP